MKIFEFLDQISIKSNQVLNMNNYKRKKLTKNVDGYSKVLNREIKCLMKMFEFLNQIPIKSNQALKMNNSAIWKPKFHTLKILSRNTLIPYKYCQKKQNKYIS